MADYYNCYTSKFQTLTNVKIAIVIINWWKLFQNFNTK